MFSYISIYNYGNNKYKFCNIPIRIKNDFKNLPNYWLDKEIENNKKLVNNIIRAKTKIIDYCYCNNFSFFITCTINEEHNRNDLKWLIRTTNQIIRNLRKKYKKEFKYILIPERHKNNAWHLHGLFSDDFKNDFYINKYNYLSWDSYDRIGFTSISYIDNYDACIRYITKYVNKSFNDREKGERLYFISNNLNKPIKEQEIILKNDLSMIPDYINEFCKIYYADNEIEYNNIIKDIKEKVYSIIK